jgi:long-chain acyl-CoA synthetase
VANISAGLRSLGLNKPDAVGIVSQNRSEWTLTDQACNVTGFVSVPLYDTLGPDAIEFIINHASVRVVVASIRELKALHQIRAKCPTLEWVIVMDDTSYDQHMLASIPREMYQHRLSEIEKIGSSKLAQFPCVCNTTPSDILTICYTSGTTGMPKGVVLTHANIVAAATGIDERTPPEERDDDEVLFSYLPLAQLVLPLSAVRLSSVAFTSHFALCLCDMQHLRALGSSVDHHCSWCHRFLPGRSLEAAG